MVLQRWQSVYLLISVIAMALVAAFPAVEPAKVVAPVTDLGGAVLVSRILAAVVAVFLFVTIFKFKQLKLQQTLCLIGAVMCDVDFIVILIAKWTAVVDANINVLSFLPILGSICAEMARTRIRKDYKLIHDCDRLR